MRKLPHWVKRERIGDKPPSKMIRELLRDYILVLANTGMRDGTEASSLKWADVDWWLGADKKLYPRMDLASTLGRLHEASLAISCASNCKSHIN